ncbi:MAG: hypothetical protein EU540_00555 [Promethearchaeota archaeon]|nr:MAG: hypothetical protein EU540_00555 [Candidatus Lokiarchaeota archaeon]
MLLYLAIITCDIFVTFDDTLVNKIKENDNIEKFVKEINPQFRIMLNDLTQERVYLFAKVSKTLE